MQADYDKKGNVTNGMQVAFLANRDGEEPIVVQAESKGGRGNSYISYSYYKKLRHYRDKC